MDLGINNGLFTNTPNGVHNGIYTGTNNGVFNGVYNENLLPNNIVRDGLVLYYDTRFNKCYSKSGNIVYDLSYLLNNGTITNATNNPINNGVFDFDGNGDFIINQSSNNLNFGTSNFTINVWFRTNTSIRRTVLSRFDFDNTGTIERGYYIDVLSNGRIRAAIETNGAAFRTIDSTNTVNNNSWNYITFIRTNELTTNLYINNVIENITVSSIGLVNNINVITAPFSIARQFSYQTPIAAVSDFIGQISHVTIYRKALTQAEINQNFNATKSRFNL